ncbi:trichohyalin isoform X2 [Salarias fasciatus]|uniref:trichohyalin isoform X2 n=1 Tax=Salarias fasciatus TaxID=181472 RepID=UPI0011765095|nr:trichohyalin-like isoform X2 [Salarias fasciatus]
MPDHKLQPGGKLSRDPSPRPVMTTQLERQRDGEQEENQRKESNTVKMRDKTRHREIERTMGGYYKRERAPAPRLREEEREWRERVRRQEERIRNGRMSSNLEEREQHAESGNRKGDTFPRMRKGVAEYDRRIISTTERGDRRERERPQRAETDKWERERERDRTWYGERERGEIRSRPKEEGKSMGRRQDEHIHQKEKYQDYDAVFQERRREMAESWHDGERDTARKRDKPKSNIRDREARIPSPHRRREREAYPDRREREKAHRREGKRDTRSEGDSVERELKRERVRDREREELRYQHSKSEGDTEGNSAREADRRRERDGQRDSDREGYISRRPGGEKDRHREDVRRADREGDRRRERDFRDDRREDDRYRERRERDRRERDVNYRPAPKQPPSSSGGERNSDMESDARYQRDSYETQLRREGERHREERRDPEKGAERSERREKQHRDRIELPCNDAEQRRMWLDPRRGKTSKEEIVDQEGHRERKEEVRIKEEPDDMFLEQSHHERQTGRDKYRRDIGRETQEESVDKEEVGEILGERDKAAKEHLSDSDGGIKGSWQRGAEGKNVTDSTEESDREEEGGGDYWARSESEGGSEGGWNQDRERMLSGEDGFVTVSSGGDEEDYEKESDDEFKDCQEFWNPGYTYKDRSPVGSKGHEADEQTTEWTMTREENVDEGDDEEEQEREKRQKYVFCVIGQTLPRSGVKPNNPKPEDDHHDSEDAKQQSDDEDDVHLTLSRDEHPVASSVDTEREHHAPREDMLTSVEPAEGHSGYSPKLPDANITEEMRSTVDTPPGSMNRDSQTERLLKEWREKNKELGELKTSPVSGNPYDVVYSPVNIEQIQPLLDQINSGAMSPEEVEAIRIRISGAWSMSDEPKRHSQAPHLKWAKNVVREILGHSDEHAVDETNTEAQEDQGIKQSEAKDNKQDEAAQATEELPVFKVTAGEQDSEPELDDEELGEEPRDDGDDQSKSWGEVELRNVLETINRQKRNSRFFNAAQLYQQYSEEAQNFEILRQSRSDTLSVSEDNTASPAPSPPPARRPLPPLPPVPNVLTHAGSVTSIQSLPLPEPPRSGGRPPSPRLSISLRQSASLWRDLPAVRNSAELEELTDDQRRLQEVRFEVVTSEASYCHSLDIVVEHFVKSKQLGSLLTTQDRNWLFSRLADVRAISHSFLSKLEERVESDMMHFTVCDIIARNCPRFKMVYVPYLTNQSYQDATYQRLMNENPGFKRIVEKLERSPVCQRLPLRSFLVLPFQRITRIKLLVQNIVKRTTPGTPEATHAIKALKLVEKLIQESNDSITQMKSIESLVSLNAKVDFACRTLPLISQSRRLVREGPVTELMDFSLKETERNVYMHLFNDYLLLSLQKEGGRFTVIDHAPVSDLRAENCRVKLHSLQKNLFRLHMTNKALLLRTDTQSDKLRWISALSRPHPEIDFSAAQDFEQMQCIRAFVAQQPDELSLEKADVILVHQQSSDNWVEGTRLSDRHRGWVPKSHLETISNPRVRQRNLSDALKLTTATAAV